MSGGMQEEACYLIYDQQVKVNADWIARSSLPPHPAAICAVLRMLAAFALELGCTSWAKIKFISAGAEMNFISAG